VFGDKQRDYLGSDNQILMNLLATLLRRRVHVGHWVVQSLDSAQVLLLSRERRSISKHSEQHFAGFV
jgi:hypothetical protein